MPFASWCALRLDLLRVRLDDALVDYERRLIVFEHDYGWWSRYWDRT